MTAGGEEINKEKFKFTTYSLKYRLVQFYSVTVAERHLDTVRFGSSPSVVHRSFPQNLRDMHSRSPGPCCGTWPHFHKGLDHRCLGGTKSEEMI